MLLVNSALGSIPLLVILKFFTYNYLILLYCKASGYQVFDEIQTGCCFTINNNFLTCIIAFNLSPSIESVQAGNYGYINKTGKLVIKHQFSKVHSFSQGLAAVKIGEKWGYIDKTGKVVVKPQFSQAYSFFEGIAAVKIGDKSGYVDKTGKQAIRLQFDGDFIAGGNFIYSSEREPGSFSEGLTAVAIKDNDGTIGLGYINKRGQLVIKTEFHELTLSPPSLRYGGRFLLQ